MAKKQNHEPEPLPPLPASSFDNAALLNEELPPLMLIDDKEVGMASEFGADAPKESKNELDRLRLENLQLKAELEKIHAADQPLPNTGPGDFRVLLRHTPAPVKSVIVKGAVNEEAAWQALMQKNELKSRESKKLRALWNQARTAIAHGGFQRVFQRQCPSCKSSWTDAGQVCDVCEASRTKARKEAAAVAAVKAERDMAGVS